MKKSKSIKLHGIEILEYINPYILRSGEIQENCDPGGDPGSEPQRQQNLSDTEGLMDDLERKKEAETQTHTGLHQWS